MTEVQRYRDWPNLVAMFVEQAKSYADKPLLWAKTDGTWQPQTWRDAERAVRGLADTLRHRGVGTGDRVVIVSENRPEWAIADLAVMGAGGITTPAYVTNTVDDHVHILSDSGAVAVIASTPRLVARVREAAQRVPSVRFVVAMDEGSADSEAEPVVIPWSDAVGGESGEDPIDDQAAALNRDDVCCIIYTSGTGGLPKGVMLTHGGLLSNCAAAHVLLERLGLGDDVLLSFLPLSHSYEHTVGQFFPMAEAAEVYYAEGVDTILSNAAEVRPTIMTAVPRLYQVMHDRILREAERKGGLAERMIKMTARLGRKRYDQGGRLGFFEGVADRVLDRLVRDKIRAKFGGRLKALVSGGAPLNPEIGLFLHSLGLTLCQGYGQTETSPAVSVNVPWKLKMHTVGPPLQGVEVRIAEDGEILVRGELVMKGYWNDPEGTARTIRDGWLHTGDVGNLDEDGYLTITDRKKDIIVNAGGDNISPQRVEGMLVLQPEIGQCLVVGDRRPHLVGLIVPDADFVKQWAKANGGTTDLTALGQDPAFHKVVSDAVGRVNKSLSVIERVRRFVLADEPFTIENGEMTPTLKVRRHVVIERYRSRLDSLYSAVAS